MNLPYVEHSAEIVGALDPEQIAGMSIGDVIYDNGWMVQHALGEAALDGGGSIYLGLELPVNRCNSELLFVNNLRQISRMLAKDPGLLPYAPSFVGAVSGEDDAPNWAIAVLIEDMTQNGRYEIDPKPASEELRKNGVHLNIELSGPHALMTAKPASQEKITTFFPAPFGMTYDVQDELDEQISQARERLTVVIGEDSALAAGLNRHGRIPG